MSSLVLIPVCHCVILLLLLFSHRARSFLKLVFTLKPSNGCRFLPLRWVTLDCTSSDVVSFTKCPCPSVFYFFRFGVFKCFAWGLFWLTNKHYCIGKNWNTPPCVGCLCSFEVLLNPKAVDCFLLVVFSLALIHTSFSFSIIYFSILVYLHVWVWISFKKPRIRG